MPHLNLFCSFGRPQGGPPRTFEHAQRESRGKYTFCNVQHLSRWYGVLVMVSGPASTVVGRSLHIIHNWLIERNLPSLLPLDDGGNLFQTLHKRNPTINAVGSQRNRAGGWSHLSFGF